jgi:alanine racemase
MNKEHRCWAEISSDALRHNVRVLKDFLPAGVQICAVVKADAYGHGLERVVRAVAGEVDLYGTANLPEAERVRTQVPDAAVLILGPVLPSERAELVRQRFTPTISTVAEARALAASSGRDPLPVHFVFDTGMGRIGLWGEEALAELGEVLKLPQLKVTAISSHLPVSDEDADYTEDQLRRFASLRQRSGLEQAAILNSGGILGFGQSAYSGDLVRLGLAMYGIAPLSTKQSLVRPALTWKTRVTLVRELAAGRSISYGRTFITEAPTRVATLAVGYGDGYQRHLSGRDAEVLIEGRRCRLLGRVTMDQILVDVTGLPDIQPGAEAVLIGQQGNETVLASELATKAGTIAWEIFTGLTNRVVRIDRA